MSPDSLKMSSSDARPPAFFRSLRRRFSPVVGPVNKSSRSTFTEARPISHGRAVFNLADTAVKEIKISCWLDRASLRWGCRDTKHIAIMYLKIDTVLSKEFDIQDFDIDLAFSTLTTAKTLISGTGVPVPVNATQDPTDDEAGKVFLYDRPAPTALDNTERRWKLNGHQLSAENGGLPTIAKWRWTAIGEAPAVTDCSELHCGLALCHPGPTTPILIKYEIEGHARKIHVVRGYHKPYKFSSKTVSRPPWQLKPKDKQEELSENDLSSIDREVRERYEPLSFKLTPSLLTRLPTSPSEMSTLLANVHPTRKDRGNEYGPTQIGGNAIVYMGDHVTYSMNRGPQ